MQDPRFTIAPSESLFGLARSRGPSALGVGGLGFRVFRVLSLGFRVFRVLTLGFRVLGCWV